MRQIMAFTKKECMELTRSGKGIILLLLFFIFGIMSPAIAKITPWMFEMLSDSMADQGIVVKEVQIDAMTSWQQFFKNMSMEYIVIILLFSGILTNEIQKGTLINILTKGLARWKVIATKALCLFFAWTICYFMCFGITYGYNAYFWDNSIAPHLLLSVVTSYVFGLWLLSIILMASVFLNSGYGALLVAAVAYALVYILDMIPALEKFLPSRLTSGYALLSGSYTTSDFLPAMIITLVLILCNMGVAVIGFNRKRL